MEARTRHRSIAGPYRRLLPSLAITVDGRGHRSAAFTLDGELTTPEAAGTLSGLFRLRVSRTPNALAYRQFENGRWRDYRWHEIAAEVACWQAALAAEGLTTGDRIAMSLPNGVDWVCFDQAAMALGLVTVPLYTTDSPGNLAHILADSGARLLLLDSDALWAALVDQTDPLPALQRVVCRRLKGAAQDPRLRALDDWLPATTTNAAATERARGSAKAPSLSTSRSRSDSRSGSSSGSTSGPRSSSTSGPRSSSTSGARSSAMPDTTPRSRAHTLSQPTVHQSQAASDPPVVHSANPDALATLVYTSGTTGRSKGVMLSHRNILTNAAAVIARIPPRPSDVFLSFLPLAHAFERTVGYYLPMMAGCTIAYARSIEQLRDDLLTVRPTVLLSVPRVYDKIYLAIQDELGTEGIRRRLFDTTVRIGWQHFQASQGRQTAPGLMDRIRWPLLDRLVVRKIRARLGGRLRVAVSGGAPLSPTVGRFFAGLGLPLTEGYGLTEAAPVVTGIAPPGFRPGWVGPPLPGVEVRLGAQREIFVRGPNVCAGYWQQPSATAEAIDAEGWLHTGDVGEIDNDGYIGIRGRLKEIIVTSTGEKVPPTEMESALTMEPLFDQAMVVGEGRQFLTALLVLSDAPWHRLAARLDLDPDDPAALSDLRAVDAALTRAAARLADFPGYAQVHAVHLTRKAWTIDNGLITPTMKLKRPELMAEFGTALDALYSRPRPVGISKNGG